MISSATSKSIRILILCTTWAGFAQAQSLTMYSGNGQAVLGTVDEVVTEPVLSRLYGTDIQVLRADGHIFVMSRGRDVERADHLHDHHHHGHDHGQHHHH